MPGQGVEHAGAEGCRGGVERGGASCARARETPREIQDVLRNVGVDAAGARAVCEAVRAHVHEDVQQVASQGRRHVHGRQVTWFRFLVTWQRGARAGARACNARQPEPVFEPQVHLGVVAHQGDVYSLWIPPHLAHQSRLELGVAQILNDEAASIGLRVGALRVVALCIIALCIIALHASVLHIQFPAAFLQNLLHPATKHDKALAYLKTVLQSSVEIEKPAHGSLWIDLSFYRGQGVTFLSPKQ